MRTLIVFILLSCAALAEDQIDRLNAKYLKKQVTVSSAAFFRAINLFKIPHTNSCQTPTREGLQR